MMSTVLASEVQKLFHNSRFVSAFSSGERQRQIHEGTVPPRGRGEHETPVASIPPASLRFSVMRARVSKAGDRMQAQRPGDLWLQVRTTEARLAQGDREALSELRMRFSWSKRSRTVRAGGASAGGGSGRGTIAR